MPIGKFFYAVKKGDDGKAQVEFYADKEAADLARQIDEKKGVSLAAPQEIELEFGNSGALLSPDATTAELRAKLVEVVKAEELAAAKAKTAVVEQFMQAAPRVTSVPVPKADATAGITSLVGKTVVFAGKLQTMSRPRAKEYARTLGATVSDLVTEHTNIMVLSEGAGIKIERAQEYGTLVISEDQWNELTQRLSRTAKPQPAPGQ